MTILNSQQNRKDNIRYVIKTVCYTFVFMENKFGKHFAKKYLFRN